MFVPGKSWWSMSINWNVSLSISYYLMGMKSADCAKTQTKNFISLFLHIYLFICNFSSAEVIFYIFGTKTGTNHLVLLIYIYCKYQIPKMLYFSTNFNWWAWSHELVPSTRSACNFECTHAGGQWAMSPTSVQIG